MSRPRQVHNKLFVKDANRTQDQVFGLPQNECSQYLDREEPRQCMNSFRELQRPKLVIEEGTLSDIGLATEMQELESYGHNQDPNTKRVKKTASLPHLKLASGAI